jgi:hypothetical protein
MAEKQSSFQIALAALARNKIGGDAARAMWRCQAADELYEALINLYAVVMRGAVKEERIAALVKAQDAIAKANGAELVQENNHD